MKSAMSKAKTMHMTAEEASGVEIEDMSTQVAPG
jgi:hypothetical protein